MKAKNSKTILIVEDEAITAMAEAKTLEKHGYVVLTAFSGDKAIETSAGHPDIDLILMDIDLGPGMDGTQAAETILKTKDIPMLFLSNHTESEIVDRTEKITSYGYVVKNSGDTVLLASIRMAFKLHDAHLKLRKQKEELNKSQEILSLVFDNTPNAITITDAETNIIIEANKGIEWTGWTRDEIIGKKPIMLMNWVHPEKGNKIREIIDDTGKCVNYRIEFFKKDGTIAHAIMNSILIQIDDRPHILTISNDVTRLSISEILLLRTKDELEAANEELNATVEEVEGTNEELQTTITELEKTKQSLEHALAEREKAEEAIRQSEERLKDLTRFLPATVFETDMQGRITYVNQFALKLFGYVQDDIDKGVAVQEIFAPQHLKEMIQNFERIKKGEILGLNEYLVRRKDGATFPALIQSTRIMRNGNPTGIRGFLVDITERKLAEEALMREEELIRAVLDSLPGIFTLSDEQGRYIRWNKNLSKFSGYSDEEIGRMSPLDFVKESARSAMAEYINQVFITGETQFETDFYSKDGSSRPYMFKGKLFNFEDKPCIIGMGFDISVLRQAEEALGNALREKEALLQELQHRMKNSLAMITGIIELEADRTNNAGQKIVLNNLKQRIDSLTNLYALLFQTGMVTEVALDEYIHSIVASLTASFVAGMNTISIEPRCDYLRVNIKSAAAWGLIANELLTNALKYASPKSGKSIIRISLKAAGGEASLSVSDNGSGPPSDFDIERSAGFGLLLVRMLTRQLGGALSFARGAENVFTVRAPV